MDFPASGTALWGIYDKTGIRPEWLVPVLAYESGLNPGVSNAAGAPYYGLNQISGSQLQAIGISVADYLTWPASRQLNTVVLPYMQSAVSHYGPLKSGIRVYQANFYPASLNYARGLDDTIVAAPSAAYEQNSGFDIGKKGKITPRDLGAAVAKKAATTQVKNVLTQTYALRPLEAMTDPVMGLDFGTGPLLAGVLGGSFGTYVVAAGILGAGWWIADRIKRGKPLLPQV